MSPFTTGSHAVVLDTSERRAAEVFLLWIVGLPSDADPAVAASQLLEQVPPSPTETPLERRLRSLLAETCRTHGLDS